MLTTSASLLGHLQRADDPGAWERFVHVYSPVLYEWACHKGLKHDDALDLVQEVFVVLVKKLPEFTYDSDRGFRNWLLIVTRHKYLERCRRKKLPVDVFTEPDEVDYQPTRDAIVLKDLKSLRKINDLPVEEFWRQVSAR